MKTILHFLTTIITLLLFFIIPLQAQEQLPDTVWKKNISVGALKFSQDGQYIYTKKDNNVLKIETFTSNILDTLILNRPLMKSLNISPTGDTLIVAGNGMIWLWDTRTGESIEKLDYFGEEACFTPDGKRIVATTGKMGFDEPQILIIDIETKEIIKSFVGRYYYASNPQISLDGKYLSFTDFRGTYNTIILIDLETYEELHIFQIENGTLADNVFSDDGKYLGSIYYQNGVYLWDLKTFELIKNYRFKDMININYAIMDLKFSNDSKNLIFSYFDSDDYDPNKVIVWNIKKDTLAYEYNFPANVAKDISKDDYIVACGNLRGDFSKLYLLRPKWNETSVDENEENDFKYILKDNILKIKFDDELNNTPTIYIYDISGKLIKSISDFELQTDFKSINVNVDFLIPGVYLIEIITTKKHYSFKLMIP
jgi:WD40 repeat protein